MKKNITRIVVLLLCVLIVTGCGSKIPKLSNGDEAVVTLKGGSKISANDLYTKLKDDYALNALVNMIDKNILEKEYKNKKKDATSDAEKTMKELEDAYGDDLLNTIQYYTSYSTIEGYKEYLYINYLQNLAIEDYSKKQITDKEIKDYYEKEIVGDIKVNHILITAKVKDDMTDDEKKAKEDEAKKKVEDIIAELKKTDSKKIKDKFKELAEKNSEDDATKSNGGSLGYINKDTLDSSYDELVNAAYKLKDGEYSTKVITTELGYHVILREASKDKAPLKDVKDSIIEKLATDYKTKNPVASVKALQELRKSYDMEIVDSELKTQYAKYIQNQLAQAQQQQNQSNSQTDQQQNQSNSQAEKSN